jgi:hypothetical protein
MKFWHTKSILILFVVKLLLLSALTLHASDVTQIICQDQAQSTTITFNISYELSSMDEFKTLTIDPGNTIKIDTLGSEQAVLKNVVVSTDGFGVKRFISLGFAEALLRPVADITLDMKVSELSGFYSTPQQVEISGQHIVDHIDKKTIAPDQFLCEESMKSSTFSDNGEKNEDGSNQSADASAINPNETPIL